MQTLSKTCGKEPNKALNNNNNNKKERGVGSKGKKENYSMSIQ
jgi:hypothetical protein